MTPAVYDTLSVDIDSDTGVRFHFNAQKLRFAGFTAVYEEGQDDSAEESNVKNLPDLEEGMKAQMGEISADQHFTQPPPRYTEASLVRALEEKGIGRPSTYAPTISTIITRGYVARENKRLMPTELGKIVNDMMCNNFPNIVDIAFTAGMETELDGVEAGNSEWHKIIADFYGPFEKELQAADDAIEKIVVEDRPAGKNCPVCGKPMVIKSGRFGEFIACTGYPECKTTGPILKTIGVNCPSCGKPIVEKKSKRGKIFYGCSGYPDCSKVYWNKPIDRKCPVCGELLTEKRTKGGVTLVCGNGECGYGKRHPKEATELQEE
jgi:DNA topoisomerase-1